MRPLIIRCQEVSVYVRIHTNKTLFYDFSIVAFSLRRYATIVNHNLAGGLLDTIKISFQ